MTLPAYFTKFGCRLAAPDGPECFCGKPSELECGLCIEHGAWTDKDWAKAVRDAKAEEERER